MMTTATNSPNFNTSAESEAVPMTNHSPRYSDHGNLPVNSPQPRLGGRAVSSPWTQIVRGESDVIAAPASPSSAAIEPAVVLTAASSVAEEGAENGNGSNSNAGKKPAWNKPSNGAVEMGPVMGASWPALSESARASSMKLSSDSLKGLSDGASPVSFSQGTGTGTAIASSPSPRQASNNANSNPTPNHTIPAQQKSMKPRNGGGTSSNSGNTQQPGSQGPTGEVYSNNPSPRDHVQRNSNDHQQQQRNSFRNRNGGPHSRGEGTHSHNYGGRRDQNRGSQDWNTHRNFNGRDAHMQPQRGFPRFMRHAPPPPPPTSTPFIPPPPVTSFPGPMGYPELGSSVYYVAAPAPDSIRGVSYVPAPISPHPVFLPPPDLQLDARIVNQIEYYFSNENLIKDTFLRQKMDDQGWVPIKLIAGFKKVSLLTDDIQFILFALRSSNVVEVQGDKVRRRNDWMRWIMPHSIQFPNNSGPQSPLGSSSQDMLSNYVQSISLEEKVPSYYSNLRNQSGVNAEMSFGRSTSGDSSSQSQQSIVEEMGQFSVQGGLESPASAGNSK